MNPISLVKEESIILSLNYTVKYTALISKLQVRQLRKGKWYVERMRKKLLTRSLQLQLQSAIRLQQFDPTASVEPSRGVKKEKGGEERKKNKKFSPRNQARYNSSVCVYVYSVYKIRTRAKKNWVDSQWNWPPNPTRIRRQLTRAVLLVTMDDVLGHLHWSMASAAARIK